MMQSPSQLTVVREMRVAIIAMVLLIAVGTAGYMLLEGWNMHDAFYMTVITVFTVGFREVRELSPLGQMFTAALIIFGVGIALWGGASVLQLSISLEARTLMRRRRMRNEISKMRDHFIICGFGRIGSEVCRFFRQRGMPHVVGDSREEAIAELLEIGVPAIQGDCTEDETLRALGIAHARGLIAAAGTDADNTFIVLSARALRSDLYIVARATSPQAERKLRAAGADHVVTPYRIGGQRIAAAALTPNVVDFLDVAMQGDELSLGMDEIRIRDDSPLVGKSLLDSCIRQAFGIVILAIKRANGRLDSNPTPETVIAAGDILIALGTMQQLRDLETLATGKQLTSWTCPNQ
ncbi:MAG: potassium channel family protein [Candidatus Zipacnadales bacterium]